jgi:transposase
LADRKNGNKASKKLSSAQTKQKKVLTSLLDHWSGLILFVEQPEIPMDNNKAESSIRNPVTGRKNYYGSGSIWSAQLAAALFSILQTLGLWGINRRAWLMHYLTACAQNGGQAPQNIDSFLPWLMNQERQSELTKPYSTYPPVEPTKSLPH